MSRHRAHSPRPWRVLHAAEPGPCLLALIQMEQAAGMRPAVTTLAGLAQPSAEWAAVSEPQAHPLLSLWQKVRAWRDVMLATEAAVDYELLHAHDFSAGMAAVRNCPAVVYEVNSFVEETPGEHAGPWLGRSLRVAEQFIIARAAAIIAHNAQIHEGLVKRGAQPEHIFIMPEPAELGPDELPHLALQYDEAYRHATRRQHLLRLGRLAATLDSIGPAQLLATV